MSKIIYNVVHKSEGYILYIISFESLEDAREDFIYRCKELGWEGSDEDLIFSPKFEKGKMEIILIESLLNK